MLTNQTNNRESLDTESNDGEEEEFVCPDMILDGQVVGGPCFCDKSWDPKNHSFKPSKISKLECAHDGPLEHELGCGRKFSVLRKCGHLKQDH